MKHTALLYVFCANLYLLLVVTHSTMADMSKFKLEEFCSCDNVPVQKLSMFIHPKNFNPGLQLVDMNMSLAIPLGNDANVKVLFEVDTIVLNKHSWIYVFDLEGQFCKLMDRYIGEIWYNMQRGMGIMPHSCPVPKGNHHGVNVLLNYETMKLQTFPFGKTRITLHIYFPARPDYTGCIKAIVSNSD